jgi:hypothetical protein
MSYNPTNKTTPEPEVAAQPSFEYDTELAGSYFIQVPVEFVRNKNYSTGAKQLYQVLLTYCGSKTHAWPGQSRLADDLGVTDRTIRNWLKELVTAGLLTVKRRGLTKSNIYHLHKLPIKIAHDEEKSGRVLPLPDSESKIVPFQNGKNDRSRTENSSAELHAVNLHATEESQPDSAKNFVCDNANETAQIKNMLEKMGISRQKAWQLSNLAHNNGRGLDYLTRLSSWVQAQKHISNPAAYLATMISQNIEPPRKAGKDNAVSPIDWSKYEPGGKYSYLFRPN